MQDPAPRPSSLPAEIAGWYGTVAILCAYALSSLEVLPAASPLLAAMNLSGGLGVAWVCWHKRTWQAFWLEAIWATIAVVALARAFTMPKIDPVLLDVPTATSQVLVVRSVAGSPHRATVEAWQRNDGSWSAKWRDLPAVVGRSGIVEGASKREGDGGTPAGMHAIGIAFGYAPTGATGLVYRQATAEDWWVDDPASPHYNQWVRGKPAVSAEAMRRDDEQYSLGAVIEWNTAPVVPGRGSAIFLHLWKSPDEATSGCVAMGRGDLAQVLQWLDSRSAPRVVIAGKDGP
jgi:L,D-peptidoglycan transpeptidase YkuD (ErfK/YbiS/YcfS/YnhG family)